MQASLNVFLTLLPKAWSILAFNQALVLHQWQQVVSVFIHVAPMILTYGLRWWHLPTLLFFFCACFNRLVPSQVPVVFRGMRRLSFVHRHISRLLVSECVDEVLRRVTGRC
jgi:hypothetical protein